MRRLGRHLEAVMYAAGVAAFCAYMAIVAVTAVTR